MRLKTAVLALLQNWLPVLVALLALAPGFALADGSQTYTTPGTYTFTVPSYGTLTVQVWGGGGGGAVGAWNDYPGGAGGNSSFGSVVAYGGSGSSGLYEASQNTWYNSEGGTQAGGAGGSASGGITNETGATGATGGQSAGAGGGAYGGGGGGAGGYGTSNGWSNTDYGTAGGNGGTPGGGGGGGVGVHQWCGGSDNNNGVYVYTFYYPSGGAGAGGYASKTYQPGDLTPGSTITVVVGDGGAGGSGASVTQNGGGCGNYQYMNWINYHSGGTGGNGQVTIAWANPTCTISLNPTSIPYGSSSELSYSSKNASDFYIDNAGYVSPNTSSSFSVSPANTTDYTGYAGDGTATSTCTAAGTSPVGSLAVVAPSAPAVTIAASSSSIYVGDSTNLTATFAAGGATSTVASTPSVIYLTSGTSWTVPANWNSSKNSIEVIGGGGGGASGASGSSGAGYSGYYGGTGGTGGAGGGGGGGGSYSKVSNVTLTPGGTLAYAIGAGGGQSGAGGATYFCNSTSNCASIAGSAVIAGAKGGSGGSSTSGGAGGAASSDIGSTKYNGGTGANASGGAGGSSTGSVTGGGGGGGGYGGGGGGAAGLHGAGYNGSATGGGTGDAGSGGGAGASGVEYGSYGSGGGANGAGGAGGGAGGSSGGSGSKGGSASGGGTAGLYGAGGAGGGGGGGGGGGASALFTGGAGGAGGTGGAGSAGKQGIIVITYYPIISGNNDTLTADNIDEPLGTGLGATTNPDAGKAITFTPTEAGIYTFYAMAKTSYFQSWTSYASTTVTVEAAPSCTISFAQNPVSKGGTTTLSWTSTNATSFSIKNLGSETPNTSGQTTIGPITQATDYTGTVSAGDVQAQCTAPGSSPAGTLSVSCTQSYSCTGSGGQTITRTNTDCSTTNVATCVSPGFCQSGAPQCVYPSMSYQSFTDQGGVQRSGNLQIIPSLVYPGTATAVYWNLQYAKSCTITGSNGDGTGENATGVWSGESSGESGKATSPISGQIIYTLTCVPYDGATSTETATVNVVPVFHER